MDDKKKEIDELIKKLDHMIQYEKPKAEIEKTIDELSRLLSRYLKKNDT